MSVGMGLIASPVGRLGRGVLCFLADLGSTGWLALDSLRAIAQSKPRDQGMVRACFGQLAGLLSSAAWPVAMVHVGVGSFLSMQAFYGATFPEGTGAVVGVGLIRNGSPLLSGFILAAVLAARAVTELRFRAGMGDEDDPRSVPDRPAGPRVRSNFGPQIDATAPAIDPARLAASRILAAAFAGPLLGLWGALIGTLVGWQVAGAMLGVSTPTFFIRLFEMLWVKDVVGVGVKGAAYGAVGALFACAEGLRGEPIRPGSVKSSDLLAIRQGSFRAARRSFLVILILNSSWFLLLYLSGNPFAPSLQ
ncbi:MAG: ABC transporter permease [Isosphaeraceae bacterium]